MAFIDPDSHQAMLRHGLKTGIAAVLAYGLAQLAELQYGYWATLSAVIVMQVYVADSVQMCLYRFSGTAVGALIGMAAISVFPATQAMTVLALFLSVTFCAYMTRYNARYRMAAITVCIVILASLNQEDRLVFGLLRVAEIGIGVAAAFAVSIALWPVRAGSALKARLMERFTECARSYETIMESFLALQAGLDPHLLAGLQADILKDRALFQKVLHHERRMYREDTDLLDLKISTLERCVAHLESMLRALNSEQDKGYEILMAPELRQLSTVAVNGMRAIASGSVPDQAHLSHALDNAETRLLELRNEGATKRFHLQKLVQFFAFYHGAQSMGHDILLYCRNAKFDIAPS
ncbi:FUSC family protein [Desulfomicrobium salsuginis]